jgi:pseudomonalisin
MSPVSLSRTVSILVTVFGCLALLSPASAAPAWMPTATQGAGPLLANAADLGAVPPSTPLRIVVALTMNDAAGLKQLIHDQNTPGNPRYGTRLTPAQFLAGYAPTSAAVQAVTAYLADAGFTDIQVSPNNLMVSAEGSAAAAEAAFDTGIESYQQGGRTVYANLATAAVPAALSGSVLAVLGLTDAFQMQSVQLPICGPAPAPCVGQFFTPQGFQQAYDAGGTATGSSTDIAIFAEGDLTGVISDLRYAETQNGLPQVPVSVVQVSVASTDTSGADEWDLDTQMSSGIAQTLADLYIYDNASMSDADTALGFNLFASQDTAQAGSASFGICEFLAYLDGSMLADDQTFEEAAAQGQTVFSSTGDTGPTCAVVDTNGVPDTGLPFMSYPAVSPYVVAVGGTDLFVNSDGSYNTETAWEAGGGGISQLEGSPYWQAAAVPSNALGDKGVPDMAMDAGLETGALVYIGGVENMVGGTSLASPLALGSWARLQSAHANGLGFAAPRLYALTTGLLTPASGFHDIVVGCNGLYCATPGWDYTTGLGTFDITLLSGLLSP